MNIKQSNFIVSMMRLHHKEMGLGLFIYEFIETRNFRLECSISIARRVPEDLCGSHDCITIIRQLFFNQTGSCFPVWAEYAIKDHIT